MKQICILGLILFSMISCQPSTSYEADREAILNSMLESQACWNDGDLEGFMHNYAHQDSIMFIGKSGITYGWEASLARYKKGYPSADARGQLHYDFLHLDPIGEKQYIQVGQYTLFRAKDTLSGYFTLIWEKIDGEWKITLDHSS